MYNISKELVIVTALCGCSLFTLVLIAVVVSLAVGRTRRQSSSGLPSPPVAQAGWMTDPLGRHELRFWDGTRWTDHVSDGGATSSDPVK